MAGKGIGEQYRQPARVSQQQWAKTQAVTPVTAPVQVTPVPSSGLAEFESKLSTLPVELQTAYKEKGVEGYNKAVETYNTKVQADIAGFESELKSQPVELQEAYKSGGAEAYNKAVAVYNARIGAQEPSYEPSSPAGTGQEANIQRLQDEIALIDEVIAGGNVLDPWGTGWDTEVAAMRRDRDSKLAAISLLQSEGASSPQIQLLTSAKMSPFVKFNKDGSYSVDVALALKAGMNYKDIKKLGVTAIEIPGVGWLGGQIAPDMYETYLENKDRYAALGKPPPIHYNLMQAGYVTVIPYMDPGKAVTYAQPIGTRMMFHNENGVAIPTKLVNDVTGKLILKFSADGSFSFADVLKATESGKLSGDQTIALIGKVNYDNLDRIVSSTQDFNTWFGGLNYYQKDIYDKAGGGQVGIDAVISAQQQAEQSLSDFRTKDGYLLQDANRAGVTQQTLMLAGFTTNQIVEGTGVQPGGAVRPVLTPQQIIGTAVITQERKIVESATYPQGFTGFSRTYGVDKYGNQIPIASKKIPVAYVGEFSIDGQIYRRKFATQHELEEFQYEATQLTLHRKTFNLPFDGQINVNTLPLAKVIAKVTGKSLETIDVSPQGVLNAMSYPEVQLVMMTSMVPEAAYGVAKFFGSIPKPVLYGGIAAQTGIMTQQTVVNWKNMDYLQRIQAIGLLTTPLIVIGVSAGARLYNAPSEGAIQRTQMLDSLKVTRDIMRSALPETSKTTVDRITSNTAMAILDYANVRMQLEQAQRVIAEIGFPKTPGEEALLGRARAIVERLSGTAKVLDIPNAPRTSTALRGLPEGSTNQVANLRNKLALALADELKIATKGIQVDDPRVFQEIENNVKATIRQVDSYIDQIVHKGETSELAHVQEAIRVSAEKQSGEIIPEQESVMSGLQIELNVQTRLEYLRKVADGKYIQSKLVTANDRLAELIKIQKSGELEGALRVEKEMIGKPGEDTSARARIEAEIQQLQNDIDFWNSMKAINEVQIFEGVQTTAPIYGKEDYSGALQKAYYNLDNVLAGIYKGASTASTSIVALRVEAPPEVWQTALSGYQAILEKRIANYVAMDKVPSADLQATKEMQHLLNYDKVAEKRSEIQAELKKLSEMRPYTPAELKIIQERDSKAVKPTISDADWARLKEGAYRDYTLPQEKLTPEEKLIQSRYAKLMESTPDYVKKSVSVTDGRYRAMGEAVLSYLRDMRGSDSLDYYLNFGRWLEEGAELPKDVKLQTFTKAEMVDRLLSDSSITAELDTALREYYQWTSADRKQAMDDLQTYLEEKYGRNKLDNYLKTGDWEKSEVEVEFAPEELANEAVDVSNKLKELLRNEARLKEQMSTRADFDLDTVMGEVNRIIKQANVSRAPGDAESSVGGVIRKTLDDVDSFLREDRLSEPQYGLIRLTQEALDLLNKLDKGGSIPTFVTRNIERILRDNGISDTDINTKSVSELIEMLRDRATRGDGIGEDLGTGEGGGGGKSGTRVATKTRTKVRTKSAEELAKELYPEKTPERTVAGIKPKVEAKPTTKEIVKTKEDIKTLEEKVTELRGKLEGTALTTKERLAVQGELDKLLERLTLTKAKLKLRSTTKAESKTQVAVAVAPAVQQKVSAGTKVQIATTARAKEDTASRLAVLAETKTAQQTGTKIQPETRIQTQPATQIQTQTQTQIQTRLQELTAPAPTPAPAPALIPIPTLTPIQVPVPHKPLPPPHKPLPPPHKPLPPPHKPLRIPILSRVSGGAESQRIPEGSITWYQGEMLQGRGKGRVLRPVWKYIPPEDFVSGAKPRTLYAPPIGAQHTDVRTAMGTIQVIGRAGSRVPRKVDIDLGWSDITVLNGNEIQFRSGGEKTNVGARIDSPTSGMSMESGSGNGSDLLDSELVSGTPLPQGINRIHRSKKVTRKKQSSDDEWYDRMTTLRGMRV